MLHYDEDCQLEFGNQEAGRNDPLFGNSAPTFYYPATTGGENQSM